MGRITIFALSDCPHCQRTKTALTSFGIPYTEISLSTHPYKRTDMLQLSNRLTVPQVFFNERHVGGADDTLALLQKWQDEINASSNTNNNNNNYKTMLERYQVEVEAQPEPTDPRLQVPTEPPVVEEEYQTDPILIDLPTNNNDKVTIRQVVQLLKQKLPIQDRKFKFTLYRQCFTGRDFIQTLMEQYVITEKAVALDFAKKLQYDYHIVSHVAGDAHDIDDTDNYYFRLQCHQTPLVLNSYCIWKKNSNEPVDGTALLKHCKSLWSQVAKVVTDDQGRIDYKKAPTLEEYAAFEEAVCELQNVDWTTMDRNTKLTFGINLYNLMIPYAFSKVGIGTSTLARGSFFNSASMNVGGHILSFNDLENGILRGNRKPPYAFSLPFGPQDPRRSLSFEPSEVDERIHFALNCGATSCPPVKVYSVGSIEEELRIVAMAFCEQDSNVLIDSSKNTLSLSTIFKWYRADFDPSTSDNTALATKVLEYLRGTKREQLQSMLNSGKAITIKYLTYDWSTNASDFITFDGFKVKPNVLSLF